MNNFSGTTFDPAKDGPRLGRQLAAVRDLMTGYNRWLTLAQIEDCTGSPQASISARLRDLRKAQFGGFRVQRRRRTAGTWEYRVTAQRHAETLFQM